MSETNKQAGATATPPAPPTPAAETPKVQESAPQPTQGGIEKERINEQLPPVLAKGLAEAGLKAEDVLAIKSYPEQNIWRVVTTNGQRHEFATADGKWLTKPKAKAQPAKPAAAAK